MLRRLALLVTLLAFASVVAAGPASAAPVGLRTLIPGAKGDDVRTVQSLLRQLMAERIAVDGIYGPQTTEAARRFEIANALGVNGRLTRGEQRLLRHFTREARAERRAAAALERAAAASAPAAGAADPAAPVAPAAPTAPGSATATAVLNPDGTATAPPSAPPAVHAIIAAANEIATTPYRYGGGHRTWVDTGYDCSGSVSYALHGAGLLTASAPSGAFETWGDPGPGTWVTIYAHKTHMYMVVAGLRFDTSGARPSRWQTAQRSADGFTVRHPPGL